MARSGVVSVRDARGPGTAIGVDKEKVLSFVSPTCCLIGALASMPQHLSDNCFAPKFTSDFVFCFVRLS
jgi:hypothetical protein